MIINHEMTVSKEIIKLFQSHRYEQHIFNLMKKSNVVFPGEYEIVQEQSHGECDFIEKNTGEKYDAKLPFLSEQIKLLTTGKKHTPQIQEWIKEMQEEATDFDVFAIRENGYDITKTKLYSIMKNAILKDKSDENIIFFFPFPIVISIEGSIFSQFPTDYLKAIYNKLREDEDLDGRNIFAIYPSMRKNEFVIRNLGTNNRESVVCNELEKYFSIELVGIKK